jgi:hypothetical protein
MPPSNQLTNINALIFARDPYCVGPLVQVRPGCSASWVTTCSDHTCVCTHARQAPIAAADVPQREEEKRTKLEELRVRVESTEKGIVAAQHLVTGWA